MNLLYANDEKGAYPASWYAATCEFLAPCPAVEGEKTADVCVIGAGFTGLSAALHLAKTGLSVIVLDAQRIGFGASGRNGGQLGSGQRIDQRDLLQMFGEDSARRLWELGEESKATVVSLIREHKIDCALKPGIAHFGFHDKDMHDIHDEAEFLAKSYGYSQYHPLSEEEVQTLCPSPVYKGGGIDRGGYHLHPLRLVLGLAKAAQAAGVKIYENSEVTAVDEGAKTRVKTAKGTVICERTILACNGYLGKLNASVAGRVMPINNFIVATEPLGDEGMRVLREDIAVSDTKFVVNYFRKSEDGRLLFGGGENYSYAFPKDIAATVRKPMLEIFPHLNDVRIDYAWGGTLAITMRRLPFFKKLGPSVYSASGYSGHGVGMAILAGKLISQAIHGDSKGFDTFAKLPTMPFPGGPRMRFPLLVLAMTWYSLRDRLGI